MSDKLVNDKRIPFGLGELRPEDPKESLIKFETNNGEDKSNQLKYNVPLPKKFYSTVLIEYPRENINWKEEAFEPTIKTDKNFKLISEKLQKSFTENHFLRLLNLLDNSPKTPILVNQDALSLENKRTFFDYVLFRSRGRIPNGKVGLNLSKHSSKKVEVPLNLLIDNLANDKIPIAIQRFSGEIDYKFIPDYSAQFAALKNVNNENELKKMKEESNPRFMILSHLEIVSKFEDYGVGITVGSKSVMPGGRVTIKEKNWRSTEESFKNGSSILDSLSVESSNSFENELKSEFTSKNSSEQIDSFQNTSSLSGKITIPIKAASLGIGASGEKVVGQTLTTAIEEAVNLLSKSLTKHTQKQSQKRESEQSFEIEVKSETGFERTISEEYSNNNLNKVLNFVRLALNQEFITYTCLINITVAFANDYGTFEDVPLSDLRDLVNKYVKEEESEEIYNLIKEEITNVYDYTGTCRKVVEERVLCCSKGDVISTTEKITNENLTNEEKLKSLRMLFSSLKGLGLIYRLVLTDELDKNINKKLKQIEKLIKEHNDAKTDSKKQKKIDDIEENVKVLSEELTNYKNELSSEIEKLGHLDSFKSIVEEKPTYLRFIKNSNGENPFHTDPGIPSEGVVLGTNKQVLFTGNTIWEALLGHGNALDNLALSNQYELLREMQLDNLAGEIMINGLSKKNFEEKVSNMLRTYFKGPDLNVILERVLESIRNITKN